MKKRSELPNISKLPENELIQVGITSPDEFEAGTENVFIRILTIDKTACYSKLCAL